MTGASKAAKKKRKRRRQALIGFVSTAALVGVAALITNAVQSSPSAIKNVVHPPTASKPLTITVQPDTDNCQTFMFPGKKISQVGPYPGDDKFAAWARAAGAADANPEPESTMKVLVTVRGTTSTPVLITSLTFTAKDLSPGGKPGVVVENDCGGPTEARYAQVDLDANPPKIVASSATSVTWGDTSEKVKPITFPYTISGAELEPILIIAETKNYTEWEGHLGWTDGKSSGVESIDLHGRPFLVSAVTKDSPHYIWDGKKWAR